MRDLNHNRALSLDERINMKGNMETVYKGGRYKGPFAMREKDWLENKDSMDWYKNQLHPQGLKDRYSKAFTKKDKRDVDKRRYQKRKSLIK